MAIEITMPRLSDTMESGTIIKWNVAEGDSVSAGDVVADIETDKATMEMQVFDDGTVARIAVPEGKTVDVGTVIAVIAEDGEDPDSLGDGNGAATGDEEPDDATSKSKSKPKPKTKSKPQAEGDADDDDDAGDADGAAAKPAPSRRDAAAKREGGDGGGRGGRLRISPVARQLAEDHGIDVQAIQGSGPSGRIIKRDVQQAIEAASETAAAVPSGAIARAGGVPATRVERPDDGGALATRTVPLSRMRQVIAERLVESKSTIPHYQVTVTFDMDPLLELRASLNEQLTAQSVKLSVNDFLVKACALAMAEHPEFNASWGGDHLLVHGEVNIGVAISIPAEQGGGLVVGTIRDADRASLRIISAETRRLAEKARTRGLSIDEMSDATFTISNLGMYGVDNFTAIINPPNSAILAVGAAIEKPVVRNGALTVGREMAATLSLDHRVIDGAMAAEYLQTLRRMIESPAAVLV